MIRPISLVSLLAMLSVGFASALELPIAVATLDRPTPVDFDSEIVPLLKRSCLACHHAKKAEGGLVLESLASLMKGGESGPGVVPKDHATSLLMSRATGATEPLMPPEDNAVGAKPLTSEELGLIKLWIDQGANASSPQKMASIAWQSIAPSLQPIYAVATSGDGRFAASGRGNRVTVYDLASGTELGLLTDPALPTPATDLDIVQSIAFAPDGNQIATGGFRTVKLWRKVLNKLDVAQTPLVHTGGLVVSNQDASQFAMLNGVGDVEIWAMLENRRISTISGLEAPIADLALASLGEKLLAVDSNGRLIVFHTTDGQELARFETNLNVTAMATSNDGKKTAILDSDRHVRLFRCEPILDKPHVTVTAIEHASMTAIADATAILLTRDSSPAVVVGTESGNVVILASETGEVIRTIATGAPVTAIALTSDAARIVVGGRDGRTRLFTMANGEASITLDSNASYQYTLLAAQRNVARHDAEVARQTARVTELETFATNEVASLAKVQAERDKVAETLKAEEPKLTEAMALVTATEAVIAQIKIDLDASAKQVEVAQKAVADITARINQLIADLEKQKAVQGELDKQEPKDAAKIAEATAVVTATEATIAQAKIDLDTATKQVEAMQKLVADTTARMTASTAELEKQKTAQTAAAEQKSKTMVSLTQKDQTLVNANQATERAKAAPPIQAALVLQKTRLATESKRLLSELQLRATASSSPTTAVVAGDQWIATSHADGGIRIFRLADGVLLNFLRASDAQSPAVSIRGLISGSIKTGEQAPTPSLLATYRTGSPVIWSTSVRWELERTIGRADELTISDRVTAIDYRPDGLSIAIGSGPPSRNGEVKVFSVANGELLRDFANVHSDTVLGVRFSPDGLTIASAAADRTVRLLDVATGKVIRTLEGHTNYVLSLAWQDDGIGLATASADQSVKVWDSSNGTQRRTIPGFPKEVTSITYAGATSQLITACADGQVRVYKADDGSLVRAIKSTENCLHAVSTSLDSKTILSGGQNGQLQVWLFENGQLLRDIK